MKHSMDEYAAEKRKEKHSKSEIDWLSVIILAMLAGGGLIFYLTMQIVLDAV